MRKERYKLEVGKTPMIFEFTSKGDKGLIKKRVIFEPIGKGNIFNLAFGDVDEKTGEFDDLVVTNNGDSEKILATVASKEKMIKMKEMIESTETTELFMSEAVYNPELDKYEGKVWFPEKLAEARETLAKYSLPKEWEDEIQKREREKAVWIKGQLSEANVETNTFLIVVEATESQPQLTYMVSTLTDVLQRLIKDYWGHTVNVHIKPKKEVQGEYELIDVV